MRWLRKWFSFDSLVTPVIIKVLWAAGTTLSVLAGVLMIGLGVVLAFSNTGCSGGYIIGGEYVSTSAWIGCILYGLINLILGPVAWKIIVEILSIPFIIIHKLDALKRE